MDGSGRSCIDVPDLNSGTSSGPAACGVPRAGCIDNFVALAQVGIIERVVLNLLHHRSSRNRCQRRAVELHGNRVQRNVVLASYLGIGSIGL